MDEKTNEAGQDPKVDFVNEYNKLVSKYGYNIIPVIRLELNNVQTTKTTVQNSEAPKGQAS